MTKPISPEKELPTTVSGGGEGEGKEDVVK